MSREIDISGSIDWLDGLPVPKWDLIENWVETLDDPEAEREAWTGAGRQWLWELRRVLGGRYEVLETEHFLGLACTAGGLGESLISFAEHCRSTLLSILDGVADFQCPGKQIMAALATREEYYHYISLYYPEGEHGSSLGIHIRNGYPHVALYGRDRWIMENTLAHELTHVCFHHLSMPQWLEEGLAQMFEHDMTGRSMLMVDTHMARRHKRYWSEKGLDAFWRGPGFSRSGKVQELSYQLAEILIRLLVEEARPRWFGLVREPQRRFVEFLRSASESDCGEAACREHLGYGLSELAARFLGPGDWYAALSREGDSTSLQ